MKNETQEIPKTLFRRRIQRKLIQGEKYWEVTYVQVYNTEVCMDLKTWVCKNLKKSIMNKQIIHGGTREESRDDNFFKVLTSLFIL